MSSLVAIIFFLCAIWIPIISFIEMRMFKNKKTRWMLQRKKILHNDKEILAEFCYINMQEVLLFLVGFCLALSLNYFGVLL